MPSFGGTQLHDRAPAPSIQPYQVCPAPYSAVRMSSMRVVGMRWMAKVVGKCGLLMHATNTMRVLAPTWYFGSEAPDSRQLLAIVNG